MTEDAIGYQTIISRALRATIREILANIASPADLPGDHHFYVTFATHAPGVVVSDAMRAQFPGEMTIVLEHQFEDLEVDDGAMSVTLSFNRVPERLVIPFSAIARFYDPSVEFGLQFDVDVPGTRDRAPSTSGSETPEAEDNVVSLDVFRKK